MPSRIVCSSLLNVCDDVNMEREVDGRNGRERDKAVVAVDASAFATFRTRLPPTALLQCRE